MFSGFFTSCEQKKKCKDVIFDLGNTYHFTILETKQLINESENYSSTTKIIIPAHAPSVADATVAAASTSSCFPSIHYLSWLWFRIMTSLNSDRKAGLVLKSSKCYQG